MKKVILSLGLFIGITIVSIAQNTQKAFYIGHSLSDQIAEMLLSMTETNATINFEATYQTIPGSPLRWNWDNGASYGSNPPFYYGYNDPTRGLPNGTFTTLVLTESVPRYNAIIDETYDYADSFYSFATSFNPNTRVFIYEVWHCINSGTPTDCSDDVDANHWRQRLTDDLPMWESVVNHLNNTFNPTTPVCLIPGGQGMAMLYDEIELGTVPGIDTITDFFTDDHHISDEGKYFIACIHFATLFNQTPVGQPYVLENVWGVPFDAPSAALALRLQEIAWATVNAYPNSCTESVDTPNNIATTERLKVSFYPNPANDVLNIITVKPIEKVEIYNITGRLLDAIIENKNNEVEMDISTYSSGFYFIKVYSNEQIVTKKFLKK